MEKQVMEYTFSYDKCKKTEAGILKEAELVRDFVVALVKMRKKIELTERESKTVNDYVRRFGYDNESANNLTSQTLMSLANIEGCSSDSMQDPTNYFHYKPFDTDDVEMIESFMKTQERNALAQHSMFSRAQSCASYLVPLVVVAIALGAARNYGDNPFVPTAP